MHPSSLAYRLRGLLEEVEIERLAFVATVLFAGATFWFAPRLPMADLPQHAGQVAVWHDLLLGTSPWQALVYVNYFTPYLVGYGAALLLSFVMPVSAALNLLLALAYFGFVAACVALRARLGGDRRMDWLFLPGFFGYAYSWGFYTFLVAVPLGVLFVLLAHRYADRPTPALGIVLIAADVALFFSHGLVFLFANCIGGPFLLIKCRPLTRLLPALLPYLAVGLLCLIYVMVRLRLEAGQSGELFDVVWGWDTTRLNFLIFSMGWPTGGFDADDSFIALLLPMLAAPVVLGARFHRRDATAYVPFVVTLLVWVLVPAVALSTWFLYQRFALFLLPFYALMFRAPDPAAQGVVRRIWLPLLCWTFLLVHVERLLAFATESVAFDEVLAVTRPGHRALGLVLDPVSAATGSPAAYEHFPLWYQAEKAGFVDFNFAVFLPQIVRYRLDHAPTVSTDTSQAWRVAKDFDWTRDQAGIYRYFFVRSTTPLPPAYFPTGRCEPVLLKSAGPWSVFENVHCQSDAR